MQRANSTGETPSERVSPGWADAGVWHRALVEDTMCFVAVIDRDGRVLEANVDVRRALGAGESEKTHSLLDLLPEPIARERLSLIRRALDEQRAVAVEGMIWGVMRRCTYRPLEGGDVVLCVSAPAVLACDSESRDFDRVWIRAAHDDLGPLEPLTDREFEVLSLIGEGLPTSQIAHRLHRSEKTVEWHRASLGHKLGVTNRVELARLALWSGICRLPRSTPEFGASTEVATSAK